MNKLLNPPIVSKLVAKHFLYSVWFIHPVDVLCTTEDTCIHPVPVIQDTPCTSNTGYTMYQ
jgi:hypothetical protein